MIELEKNKFSDDSTRRILHLVKDPSINYENKYVQIYSKFWCADKRPDFKIESPSNIESEQWRLKKSRTQEEEDWMRMADQGTFFIYFDGR